MMSRICESSKRAIQPETSSMPLQRRVLQRCACGKAELSGGECTECAEKKLQRSASAEADTQAAPSIVHDVLRSPGQPMDAASRAFFEPKFGHDFSKVRIHADSRASESARAVQANAYTVGNDIVFANRSFASADTGLLTHELTHVVQQAGTAQTNGDLRVGAADTPYEREADRMAESMTLGRPGSSQSQMATRSLQRDPVPGTTPTPSPCGANGRSLDATERAAATDIFGTTLNLDAICIKESRVMTLGLDEHWFKKMLKQQSPLNPGEYYRTPGNTVYVGPGQKDTISKPLVMHEITHCWQSQHGVPLETKTVYAIIAHYDYGGEQGLLDAITARKCFTMFNTEQQADIVKDYYERKMAGQSLYPWSVFIDQVRSGGSCGWPVPPTPTKTAAPASALA